MALQPAYRLRSAVQITAAQARRVAKGPPEGENSGYFEVRPKGLLITSPGLLGFSNLIVPDDKYAKGDPTKEKFKANLHWTQEQAERFALQLQEFQDKNYEALMEKLREKKPKAPALKIRTAQVWLEEKLKAPNEKSRIQLPFFGFTCNAKFKNKAGEVIPTLVKAWDAKNAILDLPSLHIGMGSIVQIVTHPALYTNALMKGYCEPTLRLIGVRILKLERYGAGSEGADLGDLSQEDMEGLEADFQPEDLAQFAMGSATVQAKVKADEDSDAGGDEEVAF